MPEQQTDKTPKDNARERISAKSSVPTKADDTFRHTMTFATAAKGKPGSAAQHAANARYVRSLAIQRGLRSQPDVDVVIESTRNNRDGTTTYVYALPVFLAGTPEARTSPDEQTGLRR